MAQSLFVVIVAAGHIVSVTPPLHMPPAECSVRAAIVQVELLRMERTRDSRVFCVRRSAPPEVGTWIPDIDPREE